MAMLSQQQPQEQQFSNARLGLAFTFPATWTMATTKNSTKFTLPGSTEIKPSLEVFDVDFRADVETWTNVEKVSVEQLKRTVERQWQEELLGVPMLLTRANWKEDDIAMTSLSGLLYSATPRKLRFRLVSESATFDEVEKAWREVLLSLRTINGTLPSGETPERNPEVIPSVKPPSTFRPNPPKVAPVEARKGAMSMAVEINGRASKLFFPAGWVIEKAENGNFKASNPALPGEVTLSLIDIASEPNPGRILMRAAGASLTIFDKVTVRNEKGPLNSAAGAKIAWVHREGADKAGPILSHDSIGISDDLMWLLTYRHNLTVNSPKELAILMEFVNTSCIEKAP